MPGPFKVIRCPYCLGELDPAALVTPDVIDRVARRTAEIFSEKNPLTEKLSRESTGVSNGADRPASLPKWKRAPRSGVSAGEQSRRAADSRHAKHPPG